MSNINQDYSNNHIASDEELELKWSALEQGQRVFFRPGEVVRIMNKRKARYEAKNRAPNNSETT